MKLLYVIGSMELGGAEQHLLRVSTALRRRGYAPEVFAINPGGPLTQAFIDGGVPVHGVRLPGWATRLLRNQRLIAWAGLFLAVAALWCLYWRKRPHAIHFFLPAAYIVGGVASLFGPRCLRVMSRRSLNLYQAKHALFRRIEHWLHPRMDLVVGNSQAVVDDLIGEGIAEDKIRLVYNGVKLELFEQLKPREEVRAGLDLSADTLVFVIVANLIPYKGHADLLDAFERIAAQLPKPWACLCVGRDDGIREALQVKAAKAGIGANLHFLGSRKDVPDILGAADIGILCSHEEGFSNAVLEGMAAGLPMVVTDVGGNAEAVVDGQTGRVVPAHTPDELARALLEIAADPQRKRLGLAGRQRVETVFSMEACLQGYERLYRHTAKPSA